MSSDSESSPEELEDDSGSDDSSDESSSKSIDTKEEDIEEESDNEEKEDDADDADDDEEKEDDEEEEDDDEDNDDNEDDNEDEDDNEEDESSEENDEQLDGNDGDDLLFEEMSAPSSRKKKRRFFPFVLRMKQVESNEPFAYPSYDEKLLRENGKYLLESVGKADWENIIFKKIKAVSLMENKSIHSLYTDVIRNILSSTCSMSSIDDIILSSWNLPDFIEVASRDDKEVERILTPIKYELHPDNPCPQCGSIKSHMIRRFTRAADEGQSALFWCEKSHHWKING